MNTWTTISVIKNELAQQKLRVFEMYFEMFCFNIDS